MAVTGDVTGYEIQVRNEEDAKIGSATIPAEAIADDATVVSAEISKTEYSGNFTIADGLESQAFEISFTGLKENNDVPVKVELRIAAGLDPASVVLYHYDEEIDCTYDPLTGYVTFESATFSPFTVVFDPDVKYEDVEYVSTAEELTAALAASVDGKCVYIVMEENISDAPVNTTAPYGNYYGISVNGAALDGNGNTLDFNEGELHNGKLDNYGIMISGGTIKNVTITGVFRGIMIMDPTETVYIDNVTIGDEDVCYAINTGEGDGTQDLVVTNSTIKGWNSYGNAIKSVSFTNCTFAQGEYYTNVFGRLVKPYVDTVFENCEFSSKYYIDLSALTTDGDGNVVNPDAKIVLKNCTVNGVLLTAENWTQLIVAESDCGEGQISIEGKDGTYMTADNIFDYVIIE